MPVFGTIASKFNDDGVTALYHAIITAVQKKTAVTLKTNRTIPPGKTSTSKTIIIPPERTRYLSDIADCIRRYHKQSQTQAELLRNAWHLEQTQKHIGDSTGAGSDLLAELKAIDQEINTRINEKSRELIKEWEEVKSVYSQDELVYKVRDQEIRIPLFTKSLSHQKIPKISLPDIIDPGEAYRWMREENVSGRFPFTAGVFPLKRVDEDPTRMFAGEGDPQRTNNRFKLLSENYEAKRLSTAFDSVTLYGYDPDRRPDIYGKVGTSGVSICSLDDVKTLYHGFDLCAPNTSVSMTINGPAPIILAMFLNTAIDSTSGQASQGNRTGAFP